MSNAINISNLTVGHDRNILLDNINISSESSKLIVIIGRNGTGKSTFLKTLAGMLPPISGNFNLNNNSILELPENKRSKLLSIVTTNTTIINNISVQDFVNYGRYPYTNWLGIKNDADKEFSNNAIKQCGIENLVERDYQTLSDGEKQRVNIARAIAQNTPLIILDEPTAHLDLVNKIEVFKLLKTLTEQHQKTIIFSSHQIEYALQVCDKIWLINNSNVSTHDPKEVVESNLLDEIIDSKDVHFDKESKTFKLI